jgi:hypothetical protein
MSFPLFGWLFLEVVRDKCGLSAWLGVSMREESWDGGFLMERTARRRFRLYPERMIDGLLFALREKGVLFQRLKGMSMDVDDSMMMTSSENRSTAQWSSN